MTETVDLVSRRGKRVTVALPDWLQGATDLVVRQAGRQSCVSAPGRAPGLYDHDTGTWRKLDSSDHASIRDFPDDVDLDEPGTD